MSFAANLAVFASLGVLSGWVHFTLLWRGVDALMTDAQAGRAITAGIARGAVTIASFALAASQGTVPLCAALGGFLAARTIVVRNAERLLS